MGKAMMMDTEATSTIYDFETVTEGTTLPLVAAAVLLAVWRRDGAMVTEFRAPDADFDDKGTRWSASAIEGGYAVYGQTHHFQLIEWRRTYDEVERENSVALRIHRNLVNQAENMKVEIERVDQSTQGYDKGNQYHQDQLTKLQDKQQERKAMLLENRQKIEEQIPHWVEKLESYQQRLAELKEGKPKDLRFVFKFDEKLTGLKVGMAKGKAEAQ